MLPFFTSINVTNVAVLIPAFMISLALYILIETVRKGQDFFHQQMKLF